MVGSLGIPTASNLTRTKVRELIDGFAEPLLDGSSENCCAMVYRSALPTRQFCATSPEKFWQCLEPATNQNSDRVRRWPPLTDGLETSNTPGFTSLGACPRIHL